MNASDLRVTVESAKLRCVLEPALALGHALAPRLAVGLTRAFETWLTRSFWQVLDASELLSLSAGVPADALPDADALGDWIALRDGTDAGSWQLRWVGDNLAESQLCRAGDEALVDRYEWLAATLTGRDERVGAEPWTRVPDLRRGALDAAALSAALDGALVLCLYPRPDAAPAPAQALERLDVAVERVADDAVSTLFAAERQVVRRALAAAGLAALAQPLGPLAAMHALVLPGPDGDDPWQSARAWWYAI